MNDHAGRPRRWRAISARDGTCLVDTVGLAEVVGRGAPTLHALRTGVVAALERGVERCPHGLELFADVAGGAHAEPGVAEPDLGLALLTGLAMGSGRAPWTRGGLIALERCAPRGLTMADVGTGTGILGLRALRLGAARVDGVDVDAVAVAVARRNARVNGLASRFDVRLGSVEALTPPYDLLVLGMSEQDEAFRLLPGAAAAVRPGGWLIVTPIGGADERPEITERLAREGVDVEDVVDLGGWETVIARRQPA